MALKHSHVADLSYKFFVDIINNVYCPHAGYLNNNASNAFFYEQICQRIVPYKLLSFHL